MVNKRLSKSVKKILFQYPQRSGGIIGGLNLTRSNYRKNRPSKR